jgi:nitrite reductase/ring-hydroxylating ferredoxin subunit
MGQDELDGFVRACAVDEVPSMMPRRVVLNARGILICRGKDLESIFAVDELCPHKSESMAMGLVHEGRILCPHHQYTFDLETGRCTNQRRCLPVQTYPVKIIDGAVFVRL